MWPGSSPRWFGGVPPLAWSERTLWWFCSQLKILDLPGLERTFDPTGNGSWGVRTDKRSYSRCKKRWNRNRIFTLLMYMKYRVCSVLIHTMPHAHTGTSLAKHGLRCGWQLVCRTLRQGLAKSWVNDKWFYSWKLWYAVAVAQTKQLPQKVWQNFHELW
jgi:hypothetical protein